MYGYGYPYSNGGGIPGFSDRETDVPFSVGYMTGVRAFKVPETNDSHLTSVHYAHTWRNGVNLAICYARPQLYGPEVCARLHEGKGNHQGECFRDARCPGVRQDCQCGFWAYLRLGRNDYAAGTRRVQGIIQGWGNCVLGPLGFRAQKAELVALVPSTLTSAWGSNEPDIPANVDVFTAAVMKTYPSLPMFENMTDALRAHPLSSTEVN